MSALGMASQGTQCENKALGMASMGFFCDSVIVVPEVRRPAGSTYYHDMIYNAGYVIPDDTTEEEAIAICLLLGLD